MTDGEINPEVQYNGQEDAMTALGIRQVPFKYDTFQFQKEDIQDNIIK